MLAVLTRLLDFLDTPNRKFSVTDTGVDTLKTPMIYKFTGGLEYKYVNIL